MLGVIASMVGTLRLSPALAIRQLADAILDQGIRNALTLLDARQQRSVNQRLGVGLMDHAGTGFAETVCELLAEPFPQLGSGLG